MKQQILYTVGLVVALVQFEVQSTYANQPSRQKTLSLSAFKQEFNQKYASAFKASGTQNEYLGVWISPQTGRVEKCTVFVQEPGTAWDIGIRAVDRSILTEIYFDEPAQVTKEWVEPENSGTTVYTFGMPGMTKKPKVKVTQVADKPGFRFEIIRNSVGVTCNGLGL